MRIGKAPARNINMDMEVQDVTCAMLVHIPNLLGYYEQRLEIMKASLQTMTKNAGHPHSVLVFDNGSCEEVRNELLEMQAQGLIDLLFISKKNVGKYWGMRWIFWMAPGRVVSYTDDDMLFLPNWLSKSMEVLETYPNVGCVSAYPFRPQGQINHLICQSSINWAKDNATVWRDKVITEQWDRMTIASVGRDWNQYLEEQGVDDELVVEYEGLKAIIQGHHCQFVGYKKDLVTIHQTNTDQLMGAMLTFDKLMDSMGYLRLNTYEPGAMHVGNVVDPKTYQLLRQLGIKDLNMGVVDEPPLGSWFVLRIRPLRALLEKVYSWLYWTLSRTS
jgi:glycosyltransferase involved in cell wall biosynthesis